MAHLFLGGVCACLLYASPVCVSCRVVSGVQGNLEGTEVEGGEALMDVFLGCLLACLDLWVTSGGGKNRVPHVVVFGLRLENGFGNGW